MKNKIENKLQIEDKTVSHYYDIEAVEFLDHINFDTPDFEDDEIDYIKSICSDVRYQKIEEHLIYSNLFLNYSQRK